MSTSARRLDLRPEAERRPRGRRPVSAAEYLVSITCVPASPGVAELALKKLGEALRAVVAGAEDKS